MSTVPYNSRELYVIYSLWKGDAVKFQINFYCELKIQGGKGRLILSIILTLLFDAQQLYFHIPSHLISFIKQQLTLKSFSNFRTTLTKCVSLTDCPFLCFLL